MRFEPLPRAGIALAVALAALVALAAPARADGPLPTHLAVQPIPSVQPGREFTVTARLTTQPGAPIAGVNLQLTLNGGTPRQSPTDDTGTAAFILRVPAEGVYRLSVAFAGNGTYQPASFSQDLVAGGPNGTRLTLDPLGVIPMGRPTALTAHLTNAAGNPIAGEAVTLFINGESEDSSVTDSQGTAALKIPRLLSAGTLDVLVTFKGSDKDAPASATTELVVKRPEIELHTVPPLEGVRFTANGQTFASDQNGIAKLLVTDPGVYHVEMLPYEANQADLHVSFGRWEDDVFTPYHDVSVPTDGSPLEVGFNISYKVSWSFVDLSNHPVDPRRVTEVTVKGSDGATYTFPSDQPQWLPAQRVERRLTGLEESPLQYSIISVLLNGTNVVSAMQQRFYVKPNDHWQIQLLLFTAHFTTKDMVFGFPIGSTLRLQYPDNSLQIVPLNSNGEADVFSLARGLYKVNVENVKGISPPAPLQMSRDQDVVMLVISYLDIALGVLVALFLGPGLLLIGRPELRTVLRDGLTVARARWLGRTLPRAAERFGHPVETDGEIEGER